MKYARILLLPFSLIYWLVIVLRNLFFDIGILRTTKLSVPVISVGNISAGGTGKTPLVELLIEELRSSSKIAVVSRGYSRNSTGTVVASDGNGNIASVEIIGDEPAQIANKFKDVVIVVDEKRIRGALKALEFHPKLIILDDGFQHRYIQRDLDIVVLTAKEVTNGDYLLPAGNRREPLNALLRSNLIVVSKCANEKDFIEASNKLVKYDRPIIGSQTKVKAIRKFNSDLIKENLVGARVVAFSGIGDPESFESILKEIGVEVVKHIKFSDHHWYTEKDIDRIILTIKQFNVSYIVTTEKDVARLKDKYKNILVDEKLLIVEIQQNIIFGKDKLNELLKRVCN